MNAYPSYNKYKPSNVDWLGEIPEHWEVIPLKYLLREKLKYGANELAIDEDETQPRFVRITDISDDGTLRPDTFKSIDIQIAKEYLLTENDLLFARSGATVGKTFLYQKSWGVTAFAGYLIRARFSLHKANSKFIFFCTRSSFYWQWIKAATIQATIQNVSAEKYASFCFPLPPLSEQQKIADFLDRETAKINSLIQKRNDLIKLLQEKRSAVISHAVTKGIDPTVRLKPSNVDWLGEIPEHWMHIKIKWYSKRYTGGTPDKTNDSFWENGIIPWLNSGAVNDANVNQPSEYITLEAYLNSSAKWVPAGALLMALAGQGKTKGMVARLNFKATCNQSVAAIIPDSRLSADFLYWWLTKNYTNIRNLGGGDNRDGINLEMIGGIDSPLPPLAEQKKIADFLDRETAKIDSLIEKEKQIIEKMKEYRTALISAAVTGKIDVRGEVSHGA